jgi:hypothetical protein
MRRDAGHQKLALNEASCGRASKIKKATRVRVAFGMLGTLGVVPG